MNDEQVRDVDILLPYQVRWGDDEAAVKVWEKSRRIGASYAEACMSVLEASRPRSDGGQSTFYLSYNKEMTRQFISDCALWAKFLNKAAGEVEEVILGDEDNDITVYRITFTTDFQIWGLPSEPRSLRSKQGRVVIDEAAFVEDLPEVLKAAMALTMWGGVVRVLSTHNGEDNAFNELVKEIKEGKKPYSLHRTTITDAMEEGLYKRICLTRRREWDEAGEKKWLDSLLDYYGDGAAEELYCIPAKGGERYISRSLIERCMSEDSPVLRLEKDDEFTFKDEGVREAETLVWLEDFVFPVLAASPGEPSYAGMDFGRSGDLSVMALYEEGESGRLEAVCFLEMRNVPFAQQYQVFCYVIDGLKRFYAASLDARGNGQMIAELAAQKYGQGLVNQVMISRGFYMDCFPKYRSRLEDGEMSLPKDERILDDHRTVVMDKGVPRISERTGGKDERRHGDSVVAALMVIHAYEMDGGGGWQEYKYEPVASGNAWRGGGAGWGGVAVDARR